MNVQREIVILDQSDFIDENKIRQKLNKIPDEMRLVSTLQVAIHKGQTNRVILFYESK